MNVIPAWKAGITGKGVVVTILDDGIQYSHPDLAQNYVRFCFCRMHLKDFNIPCCFYLKIDEVNFFKLKPCKKELYICKKPFIKL